MSFHRHRCTWRSITFNEHYVDDGTADTDDEANLIEAKLNDAYYLEELQINRVSVQDYRELRQYLEGADPNEAFEGVRALTGAGRIVAPDYATLEDKAWALNEAFSVAACRVAAAAADPKGVLPFDGFRDTLPLVNGIPTKLPLRFYARPGPGRPLWVGRRQGGHARPFSFQLIAFDPFAYDVGELQSTVALGGGSVTNPGNIYTKPKIRITFSGVGHASLTINNTTTGQSFVINATTSANGEVWVIDVGKGTLTRLSDGANRYSQRVSGFISSMFLQPGSNAFTFANTTNVSSVRIDRRGAYA